MKDRDPAQLSYRPLERADLARLAALARTDRAEYFATHRDWAEMYVDRFLGAALCQGAALHYLDPTSGINDFDVYASTPRIRHGVGTPNASSRSTSATQSSVCPKLRGRALSAAAWI